MCSTSKNMQLELNQIQHRIQFLRKQNQFLLNKKDKVESSKTSKIICDVEAMRLNQYVSRDEEAVVKNCCKKSMELIRDRLNKKKAKEKFKIKNRIKEKFKNSQVAQNSYTIKGNIIGESKEKISHTKNVDDIVTILDEDSAEACDLICKPNLYEKMNEIPEDIDHSTDVVYLETVNPNNCIKNDSLNRKRKIDLVVSKNKVLKNISNSVKRIATSEKSTKKRKKFLCENSKLNNILKHNIVEKSINEQIVIDKISTNNSTEVEDQDVFFLQNVNKPSNLHDKDDRPTFYDMKLNKISKGTAKREVYLPNNDSQLKFDINSTKSLIEIKHTDGQICETSNSSTNFSSDEIKILEQQDYSSALVPEWDFAEVPVDFPIPVLHKDENVETSFEKLNNLKSRGVKIKAGRWSKQEVALLRRNMKNFTTQFQVTDVCFLLGIGRTLSFVKHDYKNIKKFWKVKHFLVRLGKDLDDRPLSSIYHKSRILFDPLSNNREVSAQDISYLLNLQKKYGNNWYLIAQKFGRNYLVCQQLYIKNNKYTNEGKWSGEEEEKLIDAIKKVTKTEKDCLKNLKGIPWSKVSEFVPTRNSVQCFNKWQHKKLLL